LRHVLDAERETRDLPRSVIRFGDLLHDHRRVLGQMSRRLAVKWPRSLTTARAEIEEFLSLTDRHHSVDDRCLEGRLDMPEQVRRAYRALVTIARDGENGEAHAELDQIGSDLDRAAETFGPILADVTRANRARTAEIDELRKSFDQLQTVLLER